MQRIAKFELLEDYFGELNVSDLVNIVKIELEFYERLSAENCNDKSLPFFDEAVRIDWNVWKEFYVPQKSAKKEDDLEEFLEVNLEAQLFELYFRLRHDSLRLFTAKILTEPSKKVEKIQRTKFGHFSLCRIVSMSRNGPTNLAYLIIGWK
uniref:Uncharacterized protein n=1 Tax=Globodera rostochiensis TaxID=31243 RepID=A0A914ICS3_GLORO